MCFKQQVERETKTSNESRGCIDNHKGNSFWNSATSLHPTACRSSHGAFYCHGTPWKAGVVHCHKPRQATPGFAVYLPCLQLSFSFLNQCHLPFSAVCYEMWACFLLLSRIRWDSGSSTEAGSILSMSKLWVELFPRLFVVQTKESLYRVPCVVQSLCHHLSTCRFAACPISSCCTGRSSTRIPAPFPTRALLVIGFNASGKEVLNCSWAGKLTFFSS